MGERELSELDNVPEPLMKFRKGNDMDILWDRWSIYYIRLDCNAGMMTD